MVDWLMKTQVSLAIKYPSTILFSVVLRKKGSNRMRHSCSSRCTIHTCPWQAKCCYWQIKLPMQIQLNSFPFPKSWKFNFKINKNNFQQNSFFYLFILFFFMLEHFQNTKVTGMSNCTVKFAYKETHENSRTVFFCLSSFGIQTIIIVTS